MNNFSATSPNENAIRQINLSVMRFTFGIGMLLACRGGKKNLAAYGRKAVFYRDDKDMSETQLESIQNRIFRY
jgi:hypothetical protein